MEKLTKQQKNLIKESIQDYVTELRELGYTYKQIRKFNLQRLEMLKVQIEQIHMMPEQISLFQNIQINLLRI